MHPFSDLSGCVFFDEFTGETLSIDLTSEQLEASIGEYHKLSVAEQVDCAVNPLFTKQFLPAN